ncbi:hypothetical protein ACFDTO_11425 [Microbacteriaceae bacterium 4G12]
MLTAAAVAILAITGPLSGAASAASATTVYYSVPFSQDLYVIDPIVDQSRRAEFSEWAADGFPTPVAAPVEYKTYEWDAAIYAELTLGDREDAVHLTLEQWQRAGQPAPTRNSLIAGSQIWRWDTSPELLLFHQSTVADSHKLTFGEWQRIGAPAPSYRTNMGFQKLSWLPVISKMADLTQGEGTPETFENWKLNGFPSPLVVTRYPNDRFCSTAGSPDIRYMSRALPEIILTLEQWRSAGSPLPVAC